MEDKRRSMLLNEVIAYLAVQLRNAQQRNQR